MGSRLCLIRRGRVGYTVQVEPPRISTRPRRKLKGTGQTRCVQPAKPHRVGSPGPRRPHIHIPSEYSHVFCSCRWCVSSQHLSDFLLNVPEHSRLCRTSPMKGTSLLHEATPHSVTGWLCLSSCGWAGRTTLALKTASKVRL